MHWATFKLLRIIILATGEATRDCGIQPVSRLSLSNLSVMHLLDLGSYL